jgi:hypothetical protein
VRSRTPLKVGVWFVLLLASYFLDDATNGGAFIWFVWAMLATSGAAIVNRRLALWVPPASILPLLLQGLLDHRASDDVWWTPVFFGCVIAAYLEFWTLAGLLLARIFSKTDGQSDVPRQDVSHGRIT